MEPVKKMSENDLKEALGQEGYDELAEPPEIVAPRDNPLWPKVLANLRDIYDPEIPVNIYELGLIYNVSLEENSKGEWDAKVLMTLTSPACPVAQEMPGWVQGAFLSVEGIGDVDVEIIWEPTWNPSMMAETAKMQLNMFV